MKAEWPNDTMPELPVNTESATTAATLTHICVAIRSPVRPSSSHMPSEMPAISATRRTVSPTCAPARRLDSNVRSMGDPDMGLRALEEKARKRSSA